MANDISPSRGGLMEKRGKKLFIKTFGCQMNVYDTLRMQDVMAAVGYDPTETPEEADVLVLNTCHIREKAVEKVYSDLGRVKAMKAARRRAGQDMLVVVAGCVGQAEGKEILARAPVVDLVVGPHSYHRLPDLLFRARQEGRRIVDTDFPEEDKFHHLPRQMGQRRVSAFLTIQEGCDKFCSFCVVPYTRGAEYSRPVTDILAEARRLLSQGVREITLLGQNVNAYHGQRDDGRGASLADLLSLLSQEEGLERLRYTTSHPRDMSDDLIAAHGRLEKLMPYLHLPIQSGSDRILKAMNRGHTAEDYVALVAKIRQARPDIALSTDIIVGYPGETEEDFQRTLDLVETVGFAQAYSFKYSPRPGTPAADKEDQVPEPEKVDRLQRLQALLREQQLAFNESFVGKRMPVLFEKLGLRPGQVVGRSPYLQAVHALGSESLLGEIHTVTITSAGPNSLSGAIIPAQDTKEIPDTPGTVSEAPEPKRAAS